MTRRFAMTPARTALISALALCVGSGLGADVAQASPASSAAPAEVSAVSLTAVAAAPAARIPASPAQLRTAVLVAASKQGLPYRYGAAGPNAFDCSGLVMYVWAQAGKKLPRVAHDQFLASMPISSRSARPGDLVFFGKEYKHHVGIYAGGWKIWHAPYTGRTITLETIYSPNVVFGRPM